MGYYMYSTTTSYAAGRAFYVYSFNERIGLTVVAPTMLGTFAAVVLVCVVNVRIQYVVCAAIFCWFMCLVGSDAASRSVCLWVWMCVCLCLCVCVCVFVYVWLCFTSLKVDLKFLNSQKDTVYITLCVIIKW